jgi:putative ATPase
MAVIGSDVPPKSSASTFAIGQAREDVRSGRTLAVPKHLRDSHYKGAEQLGHGKDYEYSHDQPDAWSNQAYLPETRRYYELVNRGQEAIIRERLEELRRRKQETDSP